MSTIEAYAARKAGGSFARFEYDAGSLGPDDIEIKVDSCGICHSDLSMLDNEWQLTEYPFVGGHEVIGRVAAAGDHVPDLHEGDLVGLGWTSRSCMHCDRCLAGDHNLCLSAQGTITHQHGGFADKVRCHWGWATKIPDGVDPASAGPLLPGVQLLDGPQCGSPRGESVPLLHVCDGDQTRAEILSVTLSASG